MNASPSGGDDEDDEDSGGSNGGDESDEESEYDFHYMEQANMVTLFDRLGFSGPLPSMRCYEQIDKWMHLPN